jgi:uncharacterized protein (TIGR02145 family)
MRSKGILFTIGFISIFLFACKKEKGPSLPELTTLEVSSITASSVRTGGEILKDGGASITERGVCYSLFPDPTTSNNNVTVGAGDLGAFELDLHGLAPLTKYYIRAFAINEKGTAYGNQIEFTTGSAVNLASVTTGNITNITQSAASGGGNVTNPGGSAVTARGIVYSTSENPSLNDNRVNSGSGTGSFTSQMSGLSASTTYYVRAFATNTSGTAYGAQREFTTPAPVGTVATLTTNATTAITNSGATSGGNITNTGGSSITERGVVFATTQNPTTSATKVVATLGQTGSYSVNLTGLNSNTTYYVRAYAINSTGTAYGNQQQFTTTGSGGNLPVVTTAAVTNITINSARSGGEVTGDGGAPVSARGICFATTQNPTLGNTVVTSGSGTGTFTSNLSGLTPGTTYYIRAYATNTNGTAYGNQVTFTTTGSGGSVPTLTTTAASTITAVSARAGGSISANGGADVTERGVVLHTNPNPTTSNTKFAAPTGGVGSYTVDLTGLNPNTTYYIRAYAINSNGTGYGNELTFTTTGGSVATLTTSAASNITPNGASSGGNITSDGGSPVTARGICFATTQSPTIANNVVNSGSGTGMFNANMTGLQPATLYYVRAFATNANGTAYGNQISFTTSPASGSGCQGLTMLSYNGHTYQLVEIGSQCWFRENLRTKNYRNGTAIPYLTNSAQWSSDTNGAYTQYDNNTSNEALHGLLYNWHAVANPNNLCPAGWKVPSEQDFCTMETLLGITDPCMVDGWRGSNQGTRTKDNTNWNGTNETGFSMLGSGNRQGNGSFGNFGSNGYLWTSNPDGNDAWFRAWGGNRATIQRSKFAKTLGFSVRCVKE